MELRRIGGALGAQSETLFGLSGLGDLVLTCSFAAIAQFCLWHGSWAWRELGQPPACRRRRNRGAVAARIARERGLEAPITAAVEAIPGRQAFHQPGHRGADVAPPEERAEDKGKKEQNDPMRYWLFKSEPFKWSWDMQKARGKKGEQWDGVRNYQARKQHARNETGRPRVLLTTRNQGLEVVGIVEVCALAHPDSTTDDHPVGIASTFAPVMDMPKLGGRFPTSSQPETRRDGAESTIRGCPSTRSARMKWAEICRMGGFDENSASEARPIRQGGADGLFPLQPPPPLPLFPPKILPIANTAILQPPHVPEISLLLAAEAHDLWLKSEDELHEIGLPPPFWAFAWVGRTGPRPLNPRPSRVRVGQIGTRFRHPVRTGRTSGHERTGAGAARSRPATLIPSARQPVRLNADLNDVAVETCDRRPDRHAEAMGRRLAGDVFLRPRASPTAPALVRGNWQPEAPSPRWAIRAARTCRDRGWRGLSDYEVQVTRALEDSEIKKTSVGGCLTGSRKRIDVNAIWRGLQMKFCRRELSVHHRGRDCIIRLGRGLRYMGLSSHG